MSTTEGQTEGNQPEREGLNLPDIEREETEDHSQPKETQEVILMSSLHLKMSRVFDRPITHNINPC